MGIKHLNRFLYDNCTKKSIKKIHLNQLTNKTIAIDTSIYLYKYSSEGALMENMYLFISIFKHYKITPLFIFDGKPPPEKRELLKQRRLEKKEAEEKYTQLKNTVRIDEDTKAEMDKLKRMFVRISEEEIKKVKLLMDAYGVTYYEAPGEADHLCAFLVKTGKAWGCISDDMDMFVYSCTNVIRNISLLNHTATLYDTNQILKDLEMSEQIFCEIMVLSGTDYNIHSKTSLKETIRWYYEYMKYKNKTDDIAEYSPEQSSREDISVSYAIHAPEIVQKQSFYVWLIKNTRYITDYKTLLNAYKMFTCNNCEEFEQWRKLEFVDKPVHYAKIRNIMELEGFIFGSPILDPGRRSQTVAPVAL